jgi:hypothetical protein
MTEMEHLPGIENFIRQRERLKDAVKPYLGGEFI